MSKTLLTRSVDLPEAAELGLGFAGAAAFLGAGFFSPADCKVKNAGKMKIKLGSEVYVNVEAINFLPS